MLCHAKGCSDENDSSTIQCTKCKKFTHYTCSKLPLYQIYLFKSSQRKFLCEVCVGTIPEDFIKQVKEIIDPLHEDGDVGNIALKQRVIDLEAERKELVQKNAKLENTVSSPRSKKFNEKDLLKSLDKMLDKKLVSVEERMNSTVKQALDRNKKELDQKLDFMTNESKTYAQTLQVNAPGVIQVHEMKKLLQESKNEELLEEKEKEKRNKNFVIHGLGEPLENDENNDEALVQKFFDTVRITAKPMKYFRLGKPDASKNLQKRPLKIEMNSVEDKEMVMKHLNHLKDDETLGKISVKDDLTKAEREKVKTYVDSAIEKSNASETHRFVVRGSPKNGLWLKRVPKVL